MKALTTGQVDRLRPLVGGYAVLEPKRGEYVGLLRAGLVERIDSSTPRGGLLPPLRITPAGLAALAAQNTVTEESPCSARISMLPCLSPVANGGRLPRLRSTGSGRSLPRTGSRRRSFSHGSISPSPLRPIGTGRLPHVLEDELADHLENVWRGLDARAARREAPGGYSAGYRCWSCRRFVSGPTVTCGHCGQPHGGTYHEAYAAR